MEDDPKYAADGEAGDVQGASLWEIIKAQFQHRETRQMIFSTLRNIAGFALITRLFAKHADEFASIDSVMKMIE
ncbi:hypothetical protein SAMD00019534_057530 [Acytostelium subglobosum LB1]|uniref:hypothetical protein n=1 Tax=Acytostelium subglobosum LB1 TaxID=1410327 RepID=UPI000644C672|nr:hypothetical protein SAMD00019534_057530 [Acytostelium subglobosum LB1]GAM22578.1 hypothetical protein SAMD00019534_057530 [Acytostelium subglobosum LB1]|eukprot:XP_012754698.1 hypothetical protein SAMD00019534_057530 [Acytostelium subglobosum LB1]